jgi:hypothetical protein
MWVPSLGNHVSSSVIGVDSEHSFHPSDFRPQMIELGKLRAILEVLFLLVPV